MRDDVAQRDKIKFEHGENCKKKLQKILTRLRKLKRVQRYIFQASFISWNKLTAFFLRLINTCMLT